MLMIGVIVQQIGIPAEESPSNCLGTVDIQFLFTAYV